VSRKKFSEDCLVKEGEDGSSAYVYANERDWITVETCPYEGSAMMCPAVAKRVHAALGRAIKWVESQ
jgi:hypothetical protein